MTRIWFELLSPTTDSSQKSIGIDENFFHLGGHSLKATIMMSKIQNEMHVDVPLVEVFKRPTIRQLAEYIEKMTGQHAGISVDNLIPLKKGISNTRHLFFVHDGTGQVEGYLEFCSRLDNEFNCWGIRPDAIKNYTPQNITIKEMAGKYIEKIKKVQPQGPYFIAGWSLGGTIAFEMVKQLEEAGEKTAFFSLFDSPGPGIHPGQDKGEFTLQSEINDVMEYLPGVHISEILEKVTELEELWPAIVDYLKEKSVVAETIKKIIAEHGIPGFDYDKSGIEELILHLNMTRTLLKARDKYIPSGKVKAAVHYFEALASMEIIKQRWDEYCELSVEYHTIPGDHFSIFKMPDVEKFARVFQEVLSRRTHRLPPLPGKSMIGAW
ncbi:MAG: thioesterase domain-containing protein [Candidatus Aminicenantes bacterium]|nr:thioesterase domain-containing protein [Candidatus Aminicenantes bacterium]